MNTPSDDAQQAQFVTDANIPQKVIPTYDKTPRIGQTDREIEWYLKDCNREIFVAYGLYARDFYKTKPDDAAAASIWYNSWSPRQTEIIEEFKRYKGRKSYADEKGSPVRGYRRGIGNAQTPEEKRAEDAERKRKSRANKAAGQVKTSKRANITTMTPDEKAQRKRELARLRKQKQRENAKLSPAELEKREIDDLLAIMEKLKREGPK